MGVLIGLALAYPVTAQSPQHEYQKQQIEFIPDILTPTSSPPVVPTRPAQPGGRHTSTRANGTISAESLSGYLKGSPLAEYSEQILQSPYWSTIIGICWIEQYHCQRAPGNNYWGIGGASGLKRYASPEDGIRAIAALLESYEARGKDTIEELNGYYVYPASDNWYQTVTTIKQQLENEQIPSRP